MRAVAMTTQAPPQAPTLLELFRLLASFSPKRTDLRRAPWKAYVDWAISQGIGPLAAYNLEYRLAGMGIPVWARDRMLSVYQGAANDNVMKLVNFKQTIDSLVGRKIIVLGGAAFAEALYPHIAFRPVLDIDLLVRPIDVDPLAGFLGMHGFKPDRPSEELARELGAKKGLSDNRTAILLFGDVLGTALREQEEGIFQRALPMKMYGPSVYRPELEDALLLHCLELARRGFEAPILFFVDLRELLLGAPDLGNVYSRPVDTEAVRRRASEWKLERAVYTSLAITARLFPETAEIAARAMPELRPAARKLLEKTVIDPVSDIGSMRSIRGIARLRRLLAGAHD